MLNDNMLLAVVALSQKLDHVLVFVGPIGSVAIDISSRLEKRHRLVGVITGVTCKKIYSHEGP